MTKVGNFSEFKNKVNLSNMFNLINEMNLWEEFKTYEETFIFDGRFTNFFYIERKAARLYNVQINTKTSAASDYSANISGNFRLI